MSAIPTRTRALVKQRAHHRCERCGIPTPNGHVHHRVRRREGGHAVSVCLWVCRTCHEQVHQRPQEAREGGFIVSPWLGAAGALEAPVRTPWGWRTHDDDGGVTYLEE